VGESGVTAVATFPRQALHAASLGFVHPVTGDFLEFEAPLPQDICDLLGALGHAV
jgi:23S rRNA pseudouridine1911/1915/1917 synthase